MTGACTAQARRYRAMTTCMRTCRERIHHYGTFCCAKFVCITSVSHCCITAVLIALLIGFQAYQMWMAREMGEDVVDMAVLLRFWEVKASMAVGCIVLLLISIVGFRLSTSKNRRTGLVLVALLMAALAFQVYAFAHLFASEQNLEQLDDWLGGGSIDLDKWQEFTKSSRAKSMKNFYLTFNHAFEQWGCDASTPDMSANYLQFDEETPFAPARQLNVLNRCGNAKEVACARSDHFASTVTDFCVPPDGISDCGTCLDSFLSTFRVLEGLSKEEQDKITAAHAGDMGTMFCRCLPATTAWFEGNAKLVLITLLVYIAVECVLVLSIMWLFMCGPDETAGGRKVAENELSNWHTDSPGPLQMAAGAAAGAAAVVAGAGKAIDKVEEVQEAVDEAVEGYGALAGFFLDE